MTRYTHFTILVQVHYCIVYTKLVKGTSSVLHVLLNKLYIDELEKTMACKTLLDVFETMDSIKTISTNARKEGQLSSLTEMQHPKRGTKRYFRGQVTDGTKKMRRVGFNEDQLLQLLTLDANKSPIKLSACKVQRSAYSGDLEIKLKGRTTIAQSPKKFESVQASPSSPSINQISEVNKMVNFDHVNLKVKILQINPPCTVPTGKQARSDHC